MELIKTSKEYLLAEGLNPKYKTFLRSSVIYTLSQIKRIEKSNNWIRFPYYHYVFDDQKKGFERQLKYLKNFGEFISMDQACELIQGKGVMDGRYFCLSFDDGFQCCYTNMLEIVNNLDIKVIIYLPTNSIDLDPGRKEDEEILKQNLPGYPKLISFLTWDNCKEMLNKKVSFGSHTSNHVNLSRLSKEEIEWELSDSKLLIEKKLGIQCQHFACPWGRIGIDFDPLLTTEIAQKLGYTSFATTNRGKMLKNDNLFLVKRDHINANWQNFQLKYFFGE